MNVYQINVEPKPTAGAGYNNLAVPTCGRTFAVVTESLQDAISIARGKISDKEQITGVYIVSSDVIVDYSQVTGANC